MQPLGPLPLPGKGGLLKRSQSHWGVYAGQFTRGHLTVAAAYTSLTLFEIIRLPMVTLPKVLDSLGDTWISLARIERFLEMVRPWGTCPPQPPWEWS
jgi:hypothetical protein